MILKHLQRFLVKKSEMEPNSPGEGRWPGLSPEGLHLAGPRCVQVPPDGVVVGASSHGNEEVPDGVSERDETVAFKENCAKAVKRSAHRQLKQAISVVH